MFLIGAVWFPHLLMIIPLIQRHATAAVIDALGDTRVVLVLGARQVGKSTLCSEIARVHHPATTYTLATSVLGDSGAVFRAVVSNSAGTAMSNAGT